MGDVVETVAFDLGRKLHRAAADLGDQLGGVFDGVDAVGCDRGVAGETVERGAYAVLALVADDDLHLGWLADESTERPYFLLRDLGKHRPHADATDLLVIGDRQMNRHCQLRFQHLRHHREAYRDKALHVGGAAAVELAVAFEQLERIMAPVLAHDRHHVGMPRQHEARTILRPDRDPERSLLSGLVGDALALDAEESEIALDMGDQGEVGAIADGVEADEVGEEVANAIGSGTREDRVGHCLVHEMEDGVGAGTNHTNGVAVRANQHLSFWPGWSEAKSGTFVLPKFGNGVCVVPLRPKEEGRIAIVTNAGRAAVDVGNAKGFDGGRP